METFLSWPHCVEMVICDCHPYGYNVVNAMDIFLYLSCSLISSNPSKYFCNNLIEIISIKNLACIISAVCSGFHVTMFVLVIHCYCVYEVFTVYSCAVVVIFQHVSNEIQQQEGYFVWKSFENFTIDRLVKRLWYLEKLKLMELYIAFEILLIFRLLILRKKHYIVSSCSKFMDLPKDYDLI